MSFKIIFAGTPAFAVPSLQALIESDYDVVAVYTQPDRPAGRGRHLQAPPVKELAIKNNIEVHQPKTLRDDFVQTQLKAFEADLMVVVAYGLILPKAVLETPRLGCLNVHPSLLPRWRGAAPIQRTIEAGDERTGVTIMQLDEGMDTGPILLQATYDLAGDETSAQLHDLYSEKGADLLLETISGLKSGTILPQKQNDALATHAKKIEKHEAVINWQLPAKVIANQVRAYNPWPVTNTIFDEKTMKVWYAKAFDKPTDAKPGTLVDIDHEGFYVATGEGVLKILSVQLPGKKQMAAADFVRGYENVLKPNDTFFGK